MKRADVVDMVFQHHIPTIMKREKGLGFAPTNIALCKYWGKRQTELNLPMTSSLSIAMPDKGSLTSLQPHDGLTDVVVLNGEGLPHETLFVTRISQFFDLFRRDPRSWRLKVDINMNVPVSAGLASSACGFASLVAALNDLFDWRLSTRQLSILARLGSGSAARSLWAGFVEWHAGVQPDGMDCYAEPLPVEWPELRLGLVVLSTEPKKISSRQAMQQTVDTSILYGCWPKKVARDMVSLRQALGLKNFALLGGTAESNALAMHATMLSSWPPICYTLPETLATIQKIWALRQEGLPLYFTQDAGPNLKLLFLQDDQETVLKHFPKMEVIKLFD